MGASGVHRSFGVPSLEGDRGVDVAFLDEYAETEWEVSTREQCVCDGTDEGVRRSCITWLDRERRRGNQVMEFSPSSLEQS
jgi:hypothetical protein